MMSYGRIYRGNIALITAGINGIDFNELGVCRGYRFKHVPYSAKNRGERMEKRRKSNNINRVRYTTIGVIEFCAPLSASRIFLARRHAIDAVYAEKRQAIDRKRLFFAEFTRQLRGNCTGNPNSRRSHVEGDPLSSRSAATRAAPYWLPPIRLRTRQHPNMAVAANDGVDAAVEQGPKQCPQEHRAAI